MSELSKDYFVSVAEIAAKLDQATHIAQQLSLTASNARAVVFRPLTDFIDRLAELGVLRPSPRNEP
ncbi:MAG: hypothetical protein GY928_36825 [Colwellia sp.]|nr:hypothetical protein [Colwellia sp.]